ncbi:S-adenosyl-L-methionine:benzoic acid/salicylic acid carboxyl methyltransferase [Trifolium repens]|nr:S-adenosyl-L-methionine:benzoic acid/salicylic acid carboxyl methyltransferase [Trifolium repens]
MEAAQILHMNGSVGEASYANNSLLQRKVISLTKPLRDEAITNLFCSTLPKSLAITDLGCSFGPNTMIFPDNSLHFVHSSYSLQWLSKVPQGVDNNKGKIYISSTSPSNVQKAYYKQFQTDFSLFLKCRAQELVENGHMILTFLGRKSDDPWSKECCYIWELMATVLNDMVLQGMIDEEKLNSFNIPNYYPSPLEVKLEVLTEGSFTMNRLEVSEVNWNAFDFESGMQEESLMVENGYNMAQCMRAVAELISHFGKDVIKDIFDRYRKILTDRMSKESTKGPFGAQDKGQDRITVSYPVLIQCLVNQQDMIS